jgi:hypothetical protein
LSLWLDQDPSKLVIEDQTSAELAAVADWVRKARVEAAPARVRGIFGGRAGPGGRMPG